MDRRRRQREEYVVKTPRQCFSGQFPPSCQVTLAAVEQVAVILVIIANPKKLRNM